MLRVAVIGAGVGGLACAIDLANLGFDVQLFERSSAAGGKLRQVIAGGAWMDAGPTVLTLPHVFEQLFADAGDDLTSRLVMRRAELLARHAWNREERLDLHADPNRSEEAIGAFAGKSAALGYRRFIRDAGGIFRTLDHSFMRASRPSVFKLMRRVGLRRFGDLWNIHPFDTLWRRTGHYFKDPRLRQLFGRYATYCGSSPFDSPATLMLIAYAEQAGVYRIDGGMYELARQMEALATRRGVRFRYEADVRNIRIARGRVCGIDLADGEHLAIDAVVCNGDSNALASGFLGSSVQHAVRSTRRSERSLSAITVNLAARTRGFELAHHTVFFSPDYRCEFGDLFRRHRLPAVPTVYVCAQDRFDASLAATERAERLLCLVNAPPSGDIRSFNTAEISSCESWIFRTLASFGLVVQRTTDAVVTTPTDFDRKFPGTGGALYGAASHGWRASFKRAGSRTAIPGLYLAGGGSHPGAGLPMATLSGRLAADCIAQDHASTASCARAVMSGGMSTA